MDVSSRRTSYKPLTTNETNKYFELRLVVSNARQKHILVEVIPYAQETESESVAFQIDLLLVPAMSELLKDYKLDT